jgi:hypothetical protein
MVKKQIRKCVCGKNLVPVYTESKVLVGHFCTTCGNFEVWDDKLTPVFWAALSEDALENAGNILECNPDKKYDIIIREVP